MRTTRFLFRFQGRLGMAEAIVKAPNAAAAAKAFRKARGMDVKIYAIRRLPK